MDWSAIELSLRLSTLTTLVLLILGLPLASWLAFSRWRWKFFVEAVVAWPIILPPTVLGFYVLIAIGPHSPIGQAYASIYWTRPALFIPRASCGFGALQSAVRGAALYSRNFDRG